MKKTLLTLAAVLVAGTMLASCDFSAIPNDGSLAKDRRNQGYVEPTQETTAKFWSGYAPFCGIQVWGPTEGWGKNPEIDLDEGTFGLREIGLYMPVFGAYGENGAGVPGEYDLSQIKAFECDVWTEKEGIKEMYISVFHSKDNEKHFIPKTEPEHIRYEIKPQQQGTILFLFGMETNSTDNVIHVENVAFLDADGNQITHIPFNFAEE